MGYSHYWKLKNNETYVFDGKNCFRYNPISPDEISPEDQHNFSIAFDICLRILPNYVHCFNLRNSSGDGHPVFSQDTIEFNGCAEYNESVEPFILYRDLYETMSNGTFCKTNQLPYDFPVVLCLWICSKVCDAFIFESDGGEEITQDDYTSEFIRDDLIEFIYNDDENNMDDDNEEYRLIQVIFKDIHGNIEKVYDLIH